AKDGTFVHLNAAALALLGPGRHGSLSNLLDGKSGAQDLLDRLESAGTLSFVRTLAVRIGRRHIRITARRLASSEPEGAHTLLLLDDITERRALELQLGGSAAKYPAIDLPAPGSAMGQADTEAFDLLGRVLKQETAVAAKPEAEPQLQPATTTPRRSLTHIPEIVRDHLDRMAEAVLVAKDGALLYANPAARMLLGHATAEDVINDPQLWDRFAALSQSLPATTIEVSGGIPVTATAQMSLIPWLGGPARQFVLNRVESPRAPAAKPDTVAALLPAVPPLPVPTLLPEADEELRAILDTAADGIVTLDAMARIHTFSAGAEAIFGYRIAEVADKPFADLFAPESRKVFRDYLAALQGPGLASVFNDGREMTAIVKQGGTVPLFLTLGKLQAPKSKAAFCAVVRDITQWKKTETELRQAKEVAEATSRQKSEFLAHISHELRTPLNAILGFSEVMRLQRFGRIENEKYRGYVNDIHASGGHLLSLINDLLDLSKVEAGKLELNFTSVNLADVTEHAMKMLQEQATAARVVLRKVLPADLPNVVADLRSMRQIMLNLLSNAIKFTDPGGQAIVSAQMTAAGELKLRVKDTGIGMDAEQLRGALQPFGRVVTEGREAQGTGLGLPLTKALAEANRAQFAMNSEPRKGTFIEITFPTTRVLAE
ncbi:MAG: sensor histidine kinase, partial [Aestuariivirga sp.]